MSAIDIDHLRADASPAAIRRLRARLTGKQSAKQSAIHSGLLPTLGHLLSDIESDLFPEAAYLVSVLAHEGPAYVQPILKSHVPALLLQRLSCKPALAEQLAILRCLNNIANNLPAKEPGQWEQDTTFSDLLYDHLYVGCFIIGAQVASKGLISSQLCDLTLSLLCKTCRTESQKKTLVDHGILPILAQRLAAFVVSEGLVVPSLGALDFPTSAASSIPDPAPSAAHISPVLETIALFLENSKDRTESFLSDPTLVSVLPGTKDDFAPSDVRQSPWGSNTATRTRSRNIMDGLLPGVRPKEKTGTQINLNFPPLGSGPIQRRRSSFHPVPPLISSVHLTPDGQNEKDEQPLIPFLLLTARDSRGKRRLLACKLLVILQTLGYVPESRSRAFSALLVPLLTRMLDIEEPAMMDRTANPGVYLSNGMHYSKAAPAVLGMLIMDDVELQKAAVEAKAIPKLSSSLKKTFEPSLNRKKAPWRPCKEVTMELSPASEDCILGFPVPTQRVRLEMTYREGTLQALAAAAPLKEEHRKEICDQGALSQIMQAMEPFQIRQTTSGQDEVSGNSPSTILAACGCVRALTRSVTVLRTKLVDAEVATSVIRLMSNSDPEVRIAATKVLANLAMHFSPMKESVGEAAVVKKLCEQAHSANARLRLESIWALKQLVVNASKALKICVVNELGSSWIRLLIRTDPYDIPAGEVIGLIVDREYPPRAGNSEDIIMSDDSEHEEPEDSRDATLQPLEVEDDFNLHTPEDDLAIQEQVFDLIRNLFCGDTACDLVDYVLGQMGRAEFFEILRKRLLPRKTYGATRKDNTESLAPTSIISKVLYVLVHIGACSPRWRKAVANESALLKVILAFHNHPEREIRTQFCWLAINLMFEDDVNDNASCKDRAEELRKAGYREKIAKLEHDPDLDVRERAKTATHLFNTFLDPR